MTERIDKIQDEYFKPLEQLDVWTNRIFYFFTALAIVGLFAEPAIAQIFDKEAAEKFLPIIKKMIDFILTLAVLAYFVAGIVTRIFLQPRSENARRRNFVEVAYGVKFDTFGTEGYYNSRATDPTRKKAEQLLENCLFTRRIIKRMIPAERGKTIICFVIFLTALAYNSSQIGIASLIAQAVFGEQLLSRWLRMEFLAKETERVYLAMYRLCRTEKIDKEFEAELEIQTGCYEAAKSNAGILLSSKIFNKINAPVSAEWEAIKAEFV